MRTSSICMMHNTQHSWSTRAQYFAFVQTILIHDYLCLQSAFDIFSANLFQPGPDDDMDLLLALKTNGVRNTAYLLVLFR